LSSSEFFGETRLIFVHSSACQDEFGTTPSSIVTIMSNSTSATLASKSYHPHVVLTIFYSNHNIRTNTTLQLPGGGGVSSTCGTYHFLLQSQHSHQHDAITTGGISPSDSTIQIVATIDLEAFFKCYISN
jgi:hypothetical protein